MPIGQKAINWAELAKKSEEAKTEYTDLIAGNYNFVVTKVNSEDVTKSGKPRFSMTFTVVDGPNAQSRAFYNQTIDDTNTRSLAAFFSDMSFFGLDSQYFASHPNLTNQDYEAALLQQKFNADLSYATGSNGDGKFSRFKFKSRLGSVAATATPAVSMPFVALVAPVAPVAPVATTEASTPVESFATPAPAATPAMAMPPMPPMA